MSRQALPLRKCDGVLLANKSGKAIMAKVECEKKYYTEVKGEAGIQAVGIGAKVKGAAQFDHEKVIAGYCLIPNEDNLRFEEKTRKGGLVYLSIKYDGGEPFINALPRRVPWEVVVNSKGGLEDVLTAEPPSKSVISKFRTKIRKRSSQEGEHSESGSTKKKRKCKGNVPF